MLIVMGAALAAVLVWLAVLRPAWAWREDMAQDYEIAQADLAMITTATASQDAGPASGASSGEIDLAAVVQEVGSITGLTPVTGMSPDGGFGFSLANVSTPAAFGWLAAMHERKVQATTLNVVENADATISVEGTLIPST